ncbi:Dipeptidyl aminopeptidase/acylaminoacyl peptidase [Arsukibacterium tuosuense]|uniref:Acyl-peptide hydrolase n=1 Tax=Arsukibacterium tuosuense TaxID=1323745 RepID=A0A285JF04_9GAMM|nr:S9 family peptidase [Arsukibacterium tuosuense]SNY58854.1 Dipeptidyl aminopeptidase/acylaminoacyl peptidase [Arsukibacterium tuosuense]
MRTVYLMLVLCLLPGMLLASENNNDDTRLSVERLWQMQRIGSPVVSDDGNYIVAPVTRYDVKEDKAQTRLWLFSADGKQQRPLTADGLRASEPVFSPDGKTLAFISQRDKDEAGQIYLLAMDKPGEAQRLSEVPTGVSGLKWRGKHLYFISRVWPDKSWDEMSAQLKADKDKKLSAMQWNALPYSSFDRYLDENRQAHLFRIAATASATNSGDIQPLTQPLGQQLPRANQSASSYDVDSKEQYLAFNANGWDNQVDAKIDIFLSQLGSANLEQQTVENLTKDNQAPDSNPQFSPDGKSLAFSRQLIHGFYADTARLVIYDIAKQSSRVVTSDWDRSVSSFRWANDGRGFYASIDDAATRRLYHIDARSGKPRAITKATSFGQPVQAGNSLFATNDSFLYPARLVKVDPRNGNTRRLDSFNDDILSQVELGTFESVNYKGADGKDIQMWVHYPPGFDSSKKYPLLMLIHGGPHNAFTDSFSYRWNSQTFASWGYVTAWPNFHGSSGFGQDFADAINPDWRTKPLADIQAATNWFENQSWIDTERMVAGGASYGGYLTSILLGTEHPFKALLIHAAVYNMYSQMAADFAVHSTRFGSFWDTPEIYKSISPHYAAGNFTTPTLVIHGQQDLRVPVGQGFELFRTLQSRGVESRMIYFPDENHWILKPNNSIYWYHEVKDWFNRFAEPGAR